MILEQRFITDLSILHARNSIKYSHLRVMHITHLGGGGTEFFVQNLIKKLDKQDCVSYVLRPTEDGYIKLDLPPDEFPEFQHISYTDDEKFVEILQRLQITHIHLHNLFGYRDDIFNFLIGILKKCAFVKLIVTLHDYFCFCPSINLSKNQSVICEEYTKSSCKNCKGKVAWPGNFSIHDAEQRRESFSKLFQIATKVTVPNVAVKDIVQQFFPTEKIEVIPHDESYLLDLMCQTPKIKNVKQKKTIVILGHLVYHKGLTLVEELARVNQKKGYPLNIYVIGSVDLSETLLKYGVHITGSYCSEQKALSLIKVISPDLIYIPSIWPETFCYTLSLALFSQVPVIVNSLGAQATRLMSERGDDFIVKKEVYENPENLFDFIVKFNSQVKKTYKPKAINCLSYYD